MYKILGGVIGIILLAGCSKSENSIHIQHPHFSLEFVAPVTLEQKFIPLENGNTTILYHYQEIESKKSSSLDKLTVSIDHTIWDKSLSQYAQKNHNELLNANYQINKISNKSNTIPHSKGTNIETLLRTSLVKHTNDEKRYLADYYFLLEKQVYRFTYSSTKESNRKRFIGAIQKIQF